MFLHNINYGLFLPAVFLATLGGVVLASVSPNSFPQQFVYLGISLLAYFSFSNIDIRILKSLSNYFYIFTIAILVITFVFGLISHGAIRWINLGFFTVQPSEIAKPLLVLFFASLVSSTRGNVKFIQAFLALFPVIVLILLQPDLGSSLVVIAGFIGVIFMGNIPLKYIFSAALICLLISPLMWHFMAGYQKDRILTYVAVADPLGSGYNSIQSMIAIGSGQFLGRGLGQGTQSQLLFLPERHTDFIFAALSEELGFIGSGLLILSFGILFIRIVLAIKDSEDLFVRILLGGIFLTIFSQTVINIGMNLGILPVTGIPLPFVSSGGSSLISMAATLGIASSSISSLKNRRNSGTL